MTTRILKLIGAILLAGCTHGDPYEPARCMNRPTPKPLAIDTVFVGDTALAHSIQFSVCVRPA